MCPATSVRRGRHRQVTVSRPHPRAYRTYWHRTYWRRTCWRRTGWCGCSRWCAAGMVRPACGSAAFGAASPPRAAAASAPVDPAAMTPPSLPSMGGGMPDMGSGLSGFGGQLGDLLGGLVGTSQDALSDLPELDEPSWINLTTSTRSTRTSPTTRRWRGKPKTTKRARKQKSPRPPRQIPRPTPPASLPRKSRPPSRFRQPSNRSLHTSSTANRAPCSASTCCGNGHPV